MTTKNRKRGRPKIDVLRDKLLQIRLTTDTHSAFLTWCQARGSTASKVISAYIDLCLGVPRS